MVTVSYRRIYSVYQTQRVEVIGENGRNTELLSFFIENLNLVVCATTDMKYTRVLTTVLCVVMGNKHHCEEHLLGYYAQDTPHMPSLTRSNPLLRRWTKRLSILSRTNTHTLW